VTVIDDYGHHPVEIRAVLAAAREGIEGRVIAVVQPHRFSRLGGLMDEFQSAFNDADVVYATPVYAAGETPVAGVDSAALVAGLRARGHRSAQEIAGPGCAGGRAGRDGAARRHRGVPGCGRHHEVGSRAGRRDRGRAARAGRGVSRASVAPHPNPSPEGEGLLRGVVEAQASLADFIWFRTGGAAERLVRPADVEDWRSFWPRSIPRCR
jgi:hypothetical protein